MIDTLMTAAGFILASAFIFLIVSAAIAKWQNHFKKKNSRGIGELDELFFEQWDGEERE